MDIEDELKRYEELADRVDEFNSRKVIVDSMTYLEILEIASYLEIKVIEGISRTHLGGTTSYFVTFKTKSDADKFKHQQSLRGTK